MKIEIRRAGFSDYEEMLEMYKNTLRNVNIKDYSKDEVELWLKKTNLENLKKTADLVKRWVAVDLDNKAKIVGMAQHSLNGNFSGLYVDKDYIGKAVGFKLLKLVEESIAALGIKKIKIKSTVTAKDFYLRNGYVLLGEDFFDLGEGRKIKVYLMEKDIA